MMSMVSTDYTNIEAAIHRLDELKISVGNKKLILDFKDQLAAENLTIGRQIKYIYTLGRIATMMHNGFKKANKDDIIKLVAKINNNPDLKDWTKYNYLIVIRRFYRWLRQTDDYPKEVKWIKPRIKQHKKTMPKELLNFDDIKRLANATNNLRDRCFILLLYETGGRIGEILGIKIKDFEPDQYGAKIGLQGKTGYRKIRAISSAPAISNWLSQHPDRKTENSFLFCGIGNFKKGARLDYVNFRKILRVTAKKIKLRKPINPHHFRHSRATELAKKLTEAQLCQYMGWKIGSKEAATYVHLSGRDLDNKILAIHGLKEEEKTEEQLKPISCPRCKSLNDGASKFCRECSLGLDEVSILEFDEQVKRSKENENQVIQMIQSDVKDIKKRDNKIEKLENEVKELKMTLQKFQSNIFVELEKRLYDWMGKPLKKMKK